MSNMDLPAEMFRSGQQESTVIQIQRKAYGVQNLKVNFSEIDQLAFFEGDIVLGSAKDVRESNTPVPLGIGIVGEEFRWPNGIVPYVTVEVVRSTVEAAIAHWQSKTPFKFITRTNEPDYLSFEKLTGCWSRIGRRGGKQTISVGTGCGIGAAIHEIGHSLGLWHEQSRSDRDDFIQIVWDNILETHKHNFDKHVLDGEDLGEYDFGSIMHYPAKAFSKNGQATILANGKPIGQRDGLSTGDVAAIKIMYPQLSWP
jgi:hypothetical protein